MPTVFWPLRIANDRLFPKNLWQIANWKAISNYMLHSNICEKGIGGNIGAHTFKMPRSYQVTIN